MGLIWFDAVFFTDGEDAVLCCWLPEIFRIYVTGITAIDPIYVQSASGQIIRATCLEGQIGQVRQWAKSQRSHYDDQQFLNPKVGNVEIPKQPTTNFNMI